MLAKNKKIIGLLVAVAIVGCMSRTKSGAPVTVYSKETWKSQVLDSSGPVLVDFSAVWCGPCHLMEPTLDVLAKDYHVVKVDVDKNASLRDQYNISAIPALLIFKNGKMVERFVGVTDEKTLRTALEKSSKEG